MSDVSLRQKGVFDVDFSLVVNGTQLPADRIRSLNVRSDAGEIPKLEVEFLVLHGLDLELDADVSITMVVTPGCELVTEALENGRTVYRSKRIES